MKNDTNLTMHSSDDSLTKETLAKTSFPIKNQMFRRYMYLLSFAFFLFYLTMLLTFRSTDKTFAVISVSSVKHDTYGNFFGPVGANIAEASFQIIGLTSIALAAFFLLLSSGRLIGKSPKIGLLWRSIGIFQFFLSVTAVVSLLKSSTILDKTEFATGGKIGIGFSKFLTKALGLEGSVALLSLALLLSLPLVLDIDFSAQKSIVEKNFVFRNSFLNNLLPVNKIFDFLRSKFFSKKDSLIFESPNLVNSAILVDPPTRVLAAGAKSFDIAENTLLSNARVTTPSPNALLQTSSAPKSWKSRVLSSELFSKLVACMELETPKAEIDFQVNETLVDEAAAIESKLATFGVTGKVTSSFAGPVINTHQFEPASGVKVTRVLALQDDLSLALKAQGVSMSLRPGQSAIGVELPAQVRRKISLRNMIEKSDYFNKQYTLPLVLGCHIDSSPLVTDLADMPHILVAGSTGSGKSVGINTMLLSLLMSRTPAELRVILVDPKMLELSSYENLGHLLMPVVTDPTRAAGALRWAIGEMDRRYLLLKKASVRNISSYNEKIDQMKSLPRELVNSEEELTAEKLPYIVIVIDELCDLMMTSPKDVEECVQRLAQKARASGIHLILATQRPSVDVLTGVIKANLPCRMSFQVASRHDSRTIIESIGAEKLLGKGDFLFVPPGSSRTLRGHGAFVSDAEVAKVIQLLGEYFPPKFDSDLIGKVEEASKTINKTETRSNGNLELAEQSDDEDFYIKAVELAETQGNISTSSIQRNFRIGYNKASRIMDLLIARGVVEKSGIAGKPRNLLNR